jgi:hypothetical protein
MTHLRPDGCKCVYYYFYFIDEVLGLCFLSVPTWCPFRAQFYFNGHNWLASKLKTAGLAFEQQDNTLVGISEWQQAQDLSDSLMVSKLHARMDAAVARYVADLAPLGRYHWSIAQAEYATDIIFRSAADLAPLYDHLLRTAIHAITASTSSTMTISHCSRFSAAASSSSTVSATAHCANTSTAFAHRRSHVF